jgi:hypothetical protein
MPALAELVEGSTKAPKPIASTSRMRRAAMRPLKQIRRGAGADSCDLASGFGTVSRSALSRLRARSQVANTSQIAMPAACTAAMRGA